MTNLLLTDVDGVLLDWMGAFRKYVGREQIRTTSTDPLDWHLDSWLGTTSEETRMIIEGFNRTNAFRSLEPLPCAVAVIKQLKESGWKPVAISSCGSHPEIIAHRTANLRDVFGDALESVRCLPLNESKSEVLSWYSPSFWVEDRLEGALQGTEHGHRALLLTQPHNEKKDLNGMRVARCRNWLDIYKETIMFDY